MIPSIEQCLQAALWLQGPQRGNQLIAYTIDTYVDTDFRRVLDALWRLEASGAVLKRSDGCWEITPPKPFFGGRGSAYDE